MKKNFFKLTIQAALKLVKKVIPTLFFILTAINPLLAKEDNKLAVDLYQKTNLLIFFNFDILLL